MIAVDASAVLAILLQEAEADSFKAKVLDAGGAVISPVNYWEVLVRAMAIHGEAAREVVDALLVLLSSRLRPAIATTRSRRRSRSGYMARAATRPI